MADIESLNVDIPASLRQFVAFEATRTRVSESDIAALAIGLLAHLRLHTFNDQQVVVRFRPELREIKFETAVYDSAAITGALGEIHTLGAYELSTRPHSRGREDPLPPTLRLV